MSFPVRLALLVCAWAATTMAADFDLVLRQGSVIDGTGAPARTADVGVKNGRIAAVGIIPEKGAKEMDVTGLIIAPGFIDVHTHAEDIDELPRGENFLRMGVTTLVLGNCGSSVADVGAFFRRLAATNISPNVATLIGHGTVRSRAMGGSFDRKPTAKELAAMRETVERAMQDGALGLSTGLIYLPGTFAKTDEIVALAKVVARHDGLYASHMRSEGAGIFKALDEVFTVARQGGLPAHVSHLKLSGQANWGQTEKVLAALDKARARGLRITQDQYAYTASSTSLGTLIPKKFREGGKFNEHYADPKARAEMIRAMKSKRELGGAADYSYAVIASCRHDASLNGLNLREAARKVRGSDTLEDQVATILEIQKNGGASAVFHGINEEDVQKFMRHTNTMFASDSGVRRFGEGVPHPRGYGNSARFLARYVQDLGVLPLEEAVRRMTSLPATTFRLKDRGVVREGAWADLAVFDPAQIRDHATFQSPHQYATGFRHVLVNGVEVIRRDEHTGARPGRTLIRQSP